MKENHNIFDRKILRKQNRKIKKQKKEIYYKRLDRNSLISPKNLTIPEKKPKKLKKVKENLVENQAPQQSPDLDDDDKLIEIYEKKLGITKNAKNEVKFQKQMLKDGLDSNFFNLLERIHHSSMKPLENYEKPEESIEEEDELADFIEIDDQNLLDYPQEIENLEEENSKDEEADFQVKIVTNNEDIGKKNKKSILKKGKINEGDKRIGENEKKIKNERNLNEKDKDINIETPKENKANIIKENIIKKETNDDLVKKIQSNLNKLSEGNIDNIFSQIVNLYIFIFLYTYT